MNLKNTNTNKNKKQLGGSQNLILITIIILSVILFLIILLSIFKPFDNTTNTSSLISNVNLQGPVNTFLQNLKDTTKLNDETQINKIIESIKNNTFTPSFFLLAENYYLQIPKSQL